MLKKFTIQKLKFGDLNFEYIYMKNGILIDIEYKNLLIFLINLKTQIILFYLFRGICHIDEVGIL